MARLVVLREQEVKDSRVYDTYELSPMHLQQQQERFVCLSGSIEAAADACKVSFPAADERIVRRALLLQTLVQLQ